MPKPTTSKEPAERSRAYPVIPLDEAARIIGEILDRLGEGAFSRDVLAGVLGYSNAHGGPGARKIAALNQFGLLWRRAGLYSPTELALEIVSPDGAVRQGAMRRALRQPSLFRALLDRYQPQGRLPSPLASALWRNHGITRKASHAAAETFLASAREAGVLGHDGIFLGELVRGSAPQSPQGGSLDEPLKPAGNGPASPTTEQRFEFALSYGVARLWLPMKLCQDDLEIVRKQIDFLEYQIGEELAHEP